jgi:hypothetical protein
MSETNALKTTEEPCAPAACWPDAKREADKMTASAAPPLAGWRCWWCGTMWFRQVTAITRKCVCCGLLDYTTSIGKRSVPANAGALRHGAEKGNESNL